MTLHCFYFFLFILHILIMRKGEGSFWGERMGGEGERGGRGEGVREAKTRNEEERYPSVLPVPLPLRA